MPVFLFEIKEEDYRQQCQNTKKTTDCLECKWADIFHANALRSESAAPNHSGNKQDDTALNCLFHKITGNNVSHPLENGNLEMGCSWPFGEYGLTFIAEKANI